MLTIGERIRRARLDRNMSLGEFAGAVGVAKPSAWGWEQNRSRPRQGNLAAIAGVLDMTLEELDPRRPSPDLLGLSELVDACRSQIAAAIGVSPDHVSIVVSFGTAHELLAGAGSAIEGANVGEGRGRGSVSKADADGTI